MKRIGSVLLLGFALLGALVATGDARDIAVGTITADRLSVSTLSAITANVGTLTGGTIDGVTMIAGSGDEVTLDSSGISLSAGSGSTNSVKWSDGSALRSSGDQLNLLSDSSIHLLTSFINLNANTEVDGVLRVNTLGGGGNQYVCTDNDGDLSAGAGCGPAPEPAAVAALQRQIAELRGQVEELRVLAQATR